MLECLATCRSAMLHALRERTINRPILSTGKALHDYLRAAIEHEPFEQVRVLYLDLDHRLLSDEQLSQGDFDSAAVPLRRLLRRAVELDASGLILIHNHPSGATEPSVGDRRITHRVREAARGLDLTLLDHLIVPKAGPIVSMRAAGYLR